VEAAGDRQEDDSQ
jgi:hypothetical protein